MQAQERPSFGDTASAAWRLENTMFAAYDMMREQVASRHDAPAPEGYDPFDGIRGTIFEEYPEALIDVDSPAEKTRRELKLMRELKDRETLAASGALGIAAAFGSAVLDPLILVPVGGQIKAVRGAAVAGKVAAAGNTARAGQLARIAATGSVPAELVSPLTAGIVTARAAIVGETAVESLLHASQETRTFGESALNITAATFLGGLLGSGIGKLSKKSREKALAQIEHDLVEIGGGTSEFDVPKLTQQDLVQPTDGSMSGAEIKLRRALGPIHAEKIFTAKGVQVMSAPYVRVMGRSPSINSKKTMMDLADPSGYVDTSGVQLRSSAESEVIQRVDGTLSQLLPEGDRLYIDYRLRMASEGGKAARAVKAGGRPRRAMIQAADKLTGQAKKEGVLEYHEFMELAGSASRSENSGIAEVDELGRIWDEKVYKPIWEELTTHKDFEGFLDPEVAKLDPAGGRRYLRRVYNREKMIANEGRFKEKVKLWLRGEIDDDEIDAILKRAGLEKATRGVEVEGVAPMARHTFTPEQSAAIEKALDLHAYNIFKHLTDSPLKRVSYSRETIGKSSPFKSRALTFPDEFVEEFLEQDIQVLGEQYLRTIAPDMAMYRRFKDVSLDERLSLISKEYAELRVGVSPKEAARLHKQELEDVKLISGVAMLLRGTYAVPPMHPTVTAARTIRGMNYLSMLGGVTINAIPDLGMLVLRNGFLRTFRVGFAPLVTHMKAAKLSKVELRKMGAAVELVLDSRSRIMADIGDEFVQNKTQKLVSNVSRNFSLINLQAQWNSGLKGISGMLEMTNAIEEILAEGTGKATAKGIDRLEFARLGPEMRASIREQLLKADGFKSDGPLKWSNTEAWDDPVAASEFSSAIRLLVDNTILTPGIASAPLELSTETGRTLLQFQRFQFGATNTILLSALQQSDLRAVQGITTMIALGSVVELIKNRLNDRPQPETMEDLVQAGIDRSGVVGIYGNVYNSLARATGSDTLSSRYAARNLMSSLMGPSVGTLESASRLAIQGRRMEFSESDLNTLRRLLPYNQVPYLLGIFDKLEEGTADALNLPKKRKRGRSRKVL
jgi:hypothetical protein